MRDHRDSGRDGGRDYGRDSGRSPGRYQSGRSRSPDRRKRDQVDGRFRDRERDYRGDRGGAQRRSRSRSNDHARKRPRSPSPPRRDMGNLKRAVAHSLPQYQTMESLRIGGSDNRKPVLTRNAGPNRIAKDDAIEPGEEVEQQQPPSPELNDSDLAALEDLDPDNLLAPTMREDEELAKQAEERRRRLEGIKSKYDSQPKAGRLSLEQQSADQGEGEPELQPEVVVPQHKPAAALLHLDDPTTPGDVPILEAQDIETAIELANDEGAQLAREKIALETEESAQLNHDFAFDMFSDSPAHMRTAMLAIGKHATKEAILDGEGEHLQANWDDGEGYYKPTIGERIGDRFQVQGVLGKGVFSSVLKCKDSFDKDSEGQKIVAVKMIRNNDTMRKAADKEKSILLDIALKDPQGKRFCVRLLTYLEHRHHIAFVFEYQQMNLREALKRFGKDVGINIGAVRIYARQLMVALRYLMELKVVHADIKLDNILCSEDLKTVKLCDFGSAFRETDTDNDPTPYLVSRFYRAPEIILGMNYDRAIDLWSVCVCLCELFTGHVMFPGRTNNEMLRLMMEIKGRMNNRMVRTHIRAYESMNLEPHFEQDCRFRQYETDSVTGKVVLRLVNITQPSRDLAGVLRSSKAGADDVKLVQHLSDLLDRGLNMDPTKRLTVVEALKHPFFTGKD